MIYVQARLHERFTRLLWIVCAWYVVGIGSLAADALEMPLIQVDGAGNSMAVWEVKKGAASAVQGSYLPFGASQWSSLVSISDPAMYSYLPKLSMNDSGNTVVGWIVRDTTLGVHSLYVSMYPVNGGWSPPTKLTADDENLYEFTLKMGSSNNAVVTWYSYSVTLKQEVVASSSAVFGDNSWSAPLVVDMTTQPASPSPPDDHPK